MASSLAVVLCLLSVTAASSTISNVSPVQKVIQMISDMDVKVKKDLDATNLEFEEYAKSCDDQSVEKDYAIKSATEQVTSLTATVEDAAAKISELESAIEELGGSISEKEGEIAKSHALREKEHKEFLASEKQMLETIDTLSGAVETLKSTLELAQLSPEAQSGLDTMVTSLRKIVDADFVFHEERSQVRAFLQAQEDAEDPLTLAQTETGHAAVIETIQKMLERSESTLAETRKAENEEAQNDALMVQGLESEIANAKKQLSQATIAKQSSVEGKAQAEKDLSVTQKGLSEETAALSELKRECQQAATAYEAEVKDAQAERTALAKATEILMKKFSMLQMKISTASATRDDEDARARALRKVEEVGRKYHSTSLVALAYRASADPFAKVRGMVEDMIAKLQQEAAEQADAKAFCDEEIGKASASKADKEMRLSKTQARIDLAESSAAKLTEMIASLSKELAESDAAMSDATAIRTKEAAVASKAEQDYAASEEACAAAITVLREYYEGASLMQVGSNDKAVSKGDGSGIIGMLEVAESDFAKLLAETRSAEQMAVSDFKAMSEEHKMLKATKSAEKKGKESELKSLKSSLADYGEDKESVSSELDAVVGYLSKLAPQCETKAPSYAEKKAAREAEIEGLKEALDILSDDGAALVQTSAQLRGRKA